MPVEFTSRGDPPTVSGVHDITDVHNPMTGIAQTSAVIRAHGDRLEVVGGELGDMLVSSHCLSRSKVLQDILNSCEGTGNAILPASAAAVRTWMQYVDSCGVDPATTPHHAAGGREQAGAAVTTTSLLDSLVGLCLASDALIDDEGKLYATAELAAMIQNNSDSTPTSPVLQAVTQLPEHLFLAVLSNTPLTHCLLHLPATFHPLALRAHHPSIDARSALPATPRLPLPAIQPALSAAATLTDLCELSLASLTLPHTATATITRLSSLMALTALKLSNTGLSPSTVAAVAAVLPSLPRLAALDLSDNVITADTMATLRPAIYSCACLERLHLHRTMPFTSAGYRSLPMLAADTISLARLSSLRLGGRGRMKLHCVGYDFAARLEEALRSLSCLPSLQDLALAFCIFLPADTARGIANALAALTGLEVLQLSVPCMLESEPSLDMATWELGGDAEELPGGVLCALRELYALRAVELDFSLAHRGGSSPGWQQAVTALTRLESLSLRNFGASVADVGHLSVSLKPLLRLTSLEVRSEQLQPHWFDDATAAACALPVLRVLRVPLSTRSSGCLEALLRATHLQTLILDMLIADPNDAGAPADITPWLPLVPHVTSLRCSVSSNDEWLRPLVTALAAHAGLRRLCVYATQVPREGAARDLVDAAARTGGLCHLEVAELVEDEDAAGMTLLSAADSLSRLSHLTQLHLTHYPPDADRDYNRLPRMLRAPPVSVAMASLQQLTLGVYDAAAHGACMPVLPRLALHTFLVQAVRHASAPLLLELLRQLHHLRSFSIASVKGGDGQERPVFERAAASLPACFEVNVGC
eukprot:jgi/Ulvmu1/2548/UM139_0016.1